MFVVIGSGESLHVVCILPFGMLCWSAWNIVFGTLVGVSVVVVVYPLT